MLNIDDQSNKNIDEDKEDKKENINSNNLFASLNISSVKEEYNELLQQYKYCNPIGRLSKDSI